MIKSNNYLHLFLACLPQKSTSV
uniref:Uncharacterized protein n=1 Tax=Arundo donax TaxID=35708 RepID=A0A0A9HNS8_ARUDO